MTENKKLIKLKEEIEKSQKDLYNSDLDPIIYEKKETPSIKKFFSNKTNKFIFSTTIVTSLEFIFLFELICMQDNNKFNNNYIIYYSQIDDNEVLMKPYTHFVVRRKKKIDFTFAFLI